jgi:hypothetical protein
MSRRLICLILLSFFTVVEASESSAQIVGRIRQRRAALLAPPADPAAAPGAAAPAAPPAAEGASPLPLPLRGGFIARRIQQRRELVAQEAGAAPTPASPAPTAQQQVARRQPTPPATPPGPSRAMQALRQASALAAPAIQKFSQVDLANMDLTSLQTELSNTNGSLNNELGRLSSAASWQQYFTLPGSIVDEGTVDLADLQTALGRFESVAANPNYSQIAELPSFSQAKSLLAELVNRADMPTSESPIDGPQLLDPSNAASLSTETAQAAEALPAPQPQLPRAKGEHSILVRKRS